jgi:hypothetical protein
LANSAALLGFGVLLITAALAYTVVPLSLKVEPINWWVAAGVATIGALLLAIAMLRFPKQVGELEDEAEKEPEPARSTTLYGIYLVGVGFGLLLQALMCSLVFAAAAWSVGQRLTINQAAPPIQPVSAAFDPKVQEIAKLFGGSADEAYFIVGLFALSSLVAMLGAMFFFATSLWSKMSEPEREAFDRRLFWGGLWFRIGEAILFNLVFFLVLRTYAPNQYLLLPLVSLLVGMFLKAGESLVSGIATRVFASIQALVPTDLGSQKVMKLLAFRLEGFDKAATEAEMGKVVSELVAILKGLAGVDHVEADAKALAVRAEYNASTITPEDIERKVQLKGLRMVR